MFNKWFVRDGSGRCHTVRRKLKMSMFCYQCQETAKNQGCTVVGACGNPNEAAEIIKEASDSHNNASEDSFDTCRN